MRRWQPALTLSYAATKPPVGVRPILVGRRQVSQMGDR